MGNGQHMKEIPIAGNIITIGYNAVSDDKAFLFDISQLCFTTFETVVHCSFRNTS